MGGFGSGSYARTSLRQTVEDGLTLDLNKVIRDKTLDPDYDKAGRIAWYRTRDLGVVAKIGYCSDFENKELHLVYEYNENHQDYIIKLTSSRPNFGGDRWWFLCPLTGKRTVKVYLASGTSIFASRTALNLSYQSQRESKSTRKIYRANDLRRKLDKFAPGSGAIIPRRPKGMHHKTYNSLIAEIQSLEFQGWSLVEEQLSRFY